MKKFWRDIWRVVWDFIIWNFTIELVMKREPTAIEVSNWARFGKQLEKRKCKTCGFVFWTIGNNHWHSMRCFMKRER